MARYIDADALKKMFVDGVRVHKGMCSVMNVIHNINNAPTAAVEEVKHGYWKTTVAEKNGNAYCSACNNFDWNDCNYCSKCGAKMDVTDTNVGKRQSTMGQVNQIRNESKE